MKYVLNDMSKCTGCGACASICDCISIKPDKYGFLVSNIDETKCVDCNKCKSVCPAQNITIKNLIIDADCYGFITDNELREKSSTAGIFTMLAEYVLNLNGVVFGAAWDKDFLVYQASVYDINDLDRLRGSKYVQSDTRDSFKRACEFLRHKRYVLYTGCPCQIAGLNNYLAKACDKDLVDKYLITMDLICSGNPSQFAFRDYINTRYGLNNIKSISFRDLKNWNYGLYITKTDNSVVAENGFVNLFLQHLLNKPACNDCLYQATARQGDFSVGDFWNIETLDADLYDGKGTQVVLLNSDKARDVFKNLKHITKIKQFSVQQAVDSGVGHIKHGPVKNAGYDKFYQDVDKHGFTTALQTRIYHYDIGLSHLAYPNCGTVATNYALWSLLKSLGLSVCMIETKHGANDLYYQFSKSKGYKYSNSFESDLSKLNNYIDVFIAGGDQIWNPLNWYGYKDSFYLDFVADNKKKIAFTTGWTIDDAELVKSLDNMSLTQAKLDALHDSMSRFDLIALRDDFAPYMLDKYLNIKNVKHVQDSVLLCNRDIFDRDIKNETMHLDTGYTFAYLLYTNGDNDEFIQAAKRVAKQTHTRLVIYKYFGWTVKEYDEDFNLLRQYEGYHRNWLAGIARADYVVTNSYHGMLMSLLYNKQFIAIKNHATTRFESAGRDFSCLSHVFDSPELVASVNIYKTLSDRLNYDFINSRIDREKEYAVDLLKKALNI